MVQPAPGSGDRVPQRVSSGPTMLKALLRERHWQNYGMFKRAYQQAARGLHKDLIETRPSRATLFRWQAGQIQELPYPDHCAVLEVLFPGYSARELFEITQTPELASSDEPESAARDGRSEMSRDVHLRQVPPRTRRR